MNQPTNPDWWPARQLLRNPVKKVLVCGRRLNPPLFSHVVNFPRLEIPLHGQYRNQLEIDGEIAHSVLRPGMALFAAPNCWNLPEWQPGLELLSIFFGKSQLGVSLVSARSKNYPQLAAKKYSIPRPIGGPVAHKLNPPAEPLGGDAPKARPPDLTNAPIHWVERLRRRPTA